MGERGRGNVIRACARGMPGTTISAACVLWLVVVLFEGCGPAPPTAPEAGRDFRGDMRELVLRIGAYARAKRPGFLVVPQNGLQLLTLDGDPRGEVVPRYVKAIDGVAQESLLYGYPAMDHPTPRAMRKGLNRLAALARDKGLVVMVIDYCRDRNRVERSFTFNRRRGYISFAADSRVLDAIPSYPALPFRHHCRDLTGLAGAENFLCLLDMSRFSSKNDFVNAVRETLYDMVVMDPLYLGDVPFSRREVHALKRKPCGGNRLVLAYLSIGEAEDYRPYWKETWKTSHPPWIEEENPDWPGNYKVRYWMEEWQRILMGQEDSCLDRIVDAGFDGVYLDIIDAFWYFESKAASN